MPETEAVQAGTHLDIRVDDVAAATHQIEAVGGMVLKAPAFYELDGRPVLEWAVMQDPFGNAFCVIRWPLAHQQPAFPHSGREGASSRD